MNKDSLLVPIQMYKRIVLTSLSNYVMVNTWNEKAVKLFLVLKKPFTDIACSFFWEGGWGWGGFIGNLVILAIFFR